MVVTAPQVCSFSQTPADVMLYMLMPEIAVDWPIVYGPRIVLLTFSHACEAPAEKLYMESYARLICWPIE